MSLFGTNYDMHLLLYYNNSLNAASYFEIFIIMPPEPFGYQFRFKNITSELLFVVLSKFIIRPKLSSNNVDMFQFDMRALLKKSICLNLNTVAQVYMQMQLN